MTPPNSDKLPRCRNEQKWSLLDHFGMPKMALLTEEHLANSRMVLDRAPGAWPTLHGHSQVRHPGRRCTPGPNLPPQQVVGQDRGPIRSRSPIFVSSPRKCACAAAGDADGGRARSGAPAHLPDVLRWCPRGLAHGARPLPGAASRPKSPSWPHGRCGHHFSADCHVHRGSAAIFVSFSVFGPLSGLFPQNALPFSLGSARPLTAWRWAVHLGPGRRCAATPMCCILAAGASQAQTPCPRRHFGLRAAHRASVAIDSS